MIVTCGDSRTVIHRLSIIQHTLHTFDYCDLVYNIKKKKMKYINAQNQIKILSLIHIPNRQGSPSSTTN